MRFVCLFSVALFICLWQLHYGFLFKNFHDFLLDPFTFKNMTFNHVMFLSVILYKGMGTFYDFTRKYFSLYVNLFWFY